MAPPSVLREYDYELLKRQCHSQLRLQFSYRVVNNLPVEVVSAPSLNSFKGRIDNYWNIFSFLWTSTCLFGILNALYVYVYFDHQWSASAKRSSKRSNFPRLLLLLLLLLPMMIERYYIAWPRVIRQNAQDVLTRGLYNNLAIANRSRVSCAHDTLRPSICINITPWPWNLG